MRLRDIALAAGLFFTSVNAASANVVFDLSQVAVSTGGFLSGSFTLNDALTSIVTADIVAPAGAGFAGFEYKPSNIVLSFVSSTAFGLIASGNSLGLSFTTLTTSGATLNASSYETEGGDSRRSLSGSIIGPDAVAVATPEPASLALLVTGLAGVSLRRKRRHT